MGSYSYGKKEVCAWIRKNIPATASVLDVGPCDGIWQRMLPEYHMDACEIFEPNARACLPLYNTVFHCDIADLGYGHYDFIIFGDVIEHMTVEQAQSVLAYAEDHCSHMLVAVPWLYKQDAIYGNQWERHLQDDLTEQLFNDRYPGFAVIWQNNDYAYFYKRGKQ